LLFFETFSALALYYMVETEKAPTGARRRVPVHGFTDEQIIRLCQQGRQEGFAQLLHAYQDRIYRRAYSFLRDREDALDATQDVFLRVLNAVGNFRAGEPLWPWLRKITTNTCLNKIRATGSRPQTVPLDEALDNPHPPAGRDDPQRAAELAWDRRRLAEALAQLPPLQRMVVVLRHEEQLTYDEIANVTNLPLGTVKTHLFRARRRLRQLLHGEVGA